MKTTRTFNAALALLVLTGAGFWVKHNLRRETEPLPATPVPTTSVAAPAPALASVSSLSSTAPSPAAPSLGTTLTASKDPQALTANLSRIVLDSTRPDAERTEALGHLLNLSAADPSATLRPLLVDARLSDALCGQVLDDSLNSSLTWQADANLAVLSRRKSPAIVARAREHLVFLLEVDHGTDLAQWTSAVVSAKKNWVATR